MAAAGVGGGVSGRHVGGDGEPATGISRVFAEVSAGGLEVLELKGLHELADASCALFSPWLVGKNAGSLRALHIEASRGHPLGVRGWEPIAAALPHLLHLQELLFIQDPTDESQTDLTSTAAKVVASLADQAAPKLLSFTFARAGLRTAPDLRSFASLTELGLGHNKLGDGGAAALLAMLCESGCPLEVLGLRANELTTLPAALLSQLRSLTTVWLARNALGTSGLASVLEGLPPTVRVLSLGRNGLEQLPPGKGGDFAWLQQLSHLWLNHNADLCGLGDLDRVRHCNCHTPVLEQGVTPTLLCNRLIVTAAFCGSPGSRGPGIAAAAQRGGYRTRSRAGAGAGRTTLASVVGLTRGRRQRVRASDAARRRNAFRRIMRCVVAD
eukprot:SAG11_NODE_303_length_11000_cov_7.979635_2_plen_384_part_00